MSGGREGRQRTSMAERPPPLAHLRVVDLTDLRGALAGRMLAELGADVIQVEPPGGDPGRLRPPFVGAMAAPDHSLAFLYRNAGKRGAVIDLEEESGRRRLAELLERADVLLENLGPDEQHRLGLVPGELRVRHPQLIQVAIADLGLDGPRASWRLEALPALAASGALLASGFPDRPPCAAPGHLAHDCASVLAVGGALAALLARARDGCGQSVEVSVQEAALDALDPYSIPLPDYARVYPWLPASQPRDADGPYLVLPVADGFVRLLPGTPAQVAGLLRLLWGGPPAGVRRGAKPGAARQAAQEPSHEGLREWVRELLSESELPSQSTGEPAHETSREPEDETSSEPWRAGPLLRGIAGLASRNAAGWLGALPRDALHAASTAVVAAARLVPLPAATLAAMRSAVALGRSVAAVALRSRRRSEVLRSALRLGVPMAPVHTPEEFVAAGQTRARHVFLDTGFPGIGGAPFAAAPFRFSASPTSLRRPAPALGEDAASGDVGSQGHWHAPGRGSVDPAEARPTSGTPGNGAAPPRPPLAGLRVVDLGVGAAVPELCRMLADLGAEVIKIESRASLDFLRRVTVEPGTPNRSWMFNDSSRGQRSVCLDLRTERGRELALRLCATADVVAENRRGGVVESLGLGYADVRRLRRDVIYLSSQGYGRGGPLGRAPSFGPLVSAFAGVTWAWNHADAPYPAGCSLNHPDHVASKLAAIAVLAALEHRRRTGQGQHVELAQTEAAAFLMGEVYLEGPCSGRPFAQRGNAAEHACPHGVYPCAGEDRWVAIEVAGDDAWQRLCDALGWTAEPRLAALEARLAARGEIDQRISRWTRRRSPERAAELLQQARVSAMPVQGGLEQRADRHLAARAALLTLEDPEIGPVRHVASPLRLSRTPVSHARPAPRLGADTEAVLTQLLGLSPDEVAALVATGVCR